MNTELYARSYQVGDEEKITSLLSSAFGLWPFFDISCSASEHWRWRYKENPMQESLVYVVVYGDEIISSTHCLIHHVIIRHKKHISAYSTDASVHPLYQGRGISKLHDEAILEAKYRRGVCFAFIVTVNPIVINSKNRKIHHPYSLPFEISYLSRIEDIGKHIQERKLSLGAGWIIKEIMKKILSKPVSKLDSSIKITSIEYFDSRIEGFLQIIFDYYEFIFDRTSEYLNWRYCDARGGDYKVNVAEENCEIVGYIVLRIKKNESYQTGIIVELLTIPGRIDIAEALLLFGLNYFMENNINYMSFQVVKNHPLESLLMKYGFNRRKIDTKLFYNYYGKEEIELDSILPGRIHFCSGDMVEI